MILRAPNLNDRPNEVSVTTVNGEVAGSSPVSVIGAVAQLVRALNPDLQLPVYRPFFTYGLWKAQDSSVIYWKWNPHLGNITPMVTYLSST